MQSAFPSLLCYRKDKYENPTTDQLIYLLIAFLICPNRKLKTPGHLELLGRHTE